MPIRSIAVCGRLLFFDNTVEDVILVFDLLAGSQMTRISVDAGKPPAMLDTYVFNAVIVTVGKQDAFATRCIISGVAINRQVADSDVVVALWCLLLIVVFISNDTAIYKGHASISGFRRCGGSYSF